MPYTLWSHGRLLGESDLKSLESLEHVKFGWFIPTPEGERSMDVMTGGRAQLMKLGKMLRNPMRAMMRPKDQPAGEWPADIRRTTAYADYIAYRDQLEAMRLEVRDPDGNIVDCEDIAVQDTEFTLSLARRGKRRGAEAQPVAESAPAGERYQMQVHLRVLSND
jgi:hypothetical protein